MWLVSSLLLLLLLFISEVQHSTLLDRIIALNVCCCFFKIHSTSIKEKVRMAGKVLGKGYFEV